MTPERFADDEGTMLGEQQLWQAVLAQTIAEATTGRVVGETGPQRMRLVSQARDYLTKPNPDFDIVCSLAGLEPDAVRESAQRVIAAAPSVEQLVTPKQAPRNITTDEATA